MMLTLLLRKNLSVFILLTIYVAFFDQGGGNAYAGTPDASNNNAEIVSITITPNSTPAGTYPEISCQVRNTSSLKNGDSGKATFDVKAVITAPNGSKKSLLWREVKFIANQNKLYVYTKDYDISLTGSYTVSYYVSNKTHLYTLLSKKFEVLGPTVKMKPVPVPGTISTTSKGADVSQISKKPLPEGSDRSELQAQQSTAILPKKSLTYEYPVPTDKHREKTFFGIGAAVNMLNFSIGPSLIIWPLQNLAFQGTYGVGTFTSYEARTFYRFPLSYSIRPYLGVGYLHAERSATVIGVDTTISGSSFTGFGGVELPVYKNLYAYIDVSGTALKLSKDVTNGSQTATATVKYSPVTICAGLMFYLF
jgi:hypothetical protein